MLTFHMLTAKHSGTCIIWPVHNYSKKHLEIFKHTWPSTILHYNWSSVLNAQKCVKLRGHRPCHFSTKKIRWKIEFQTVQPRNICPCRFFIDEPSNIGNRPSPAVFAAPKVGRQMVTFLDDTRLRDFPIYNSADTPIWFSEMGVPQNHGFQY